MRIALVMPRSESLSGHPRFAELWSRSAELRGSSFFSPMPNLGLLTLAGLTPRRHTVDFLDENRGPLDLGRRYDLVALTAMTLQADRAYELAKAYRATGAAVVMGGIHATVLPEEAGRHVDSVVVGEAEAVWPRVLEDAERGRLAPLYRAEGPLDPVDPPVPRYELAAGGYPVTPVQTSRGCPRDCEFCSVGSVFGKKIRVKPTARVLEEVREATLRRGKGRPRVFFADDNMFFDRGRSLELLRALAPLRVNWMTQCDVEVAEDEELLRLIRESGGSQLLIGFESLSRENLRTLHPSSWKARKLDRYAEAIRAIQSRGIRVLGMFIVGMDHDTPDVFAELEEFILSTRLHDAQITFHTPLPGTALRERLAREGRLPEERYWDRCSFFHVTYRPARMTRQELEDGHLELYRALLSPRVQEARRRHFIEIFKRMERAGPGGERSASG